MLTVLTAEWAIAVLFAPDDVERARQRVSSSQDAPPGAPVGAGGFGEI